MRGAAPALRWLAFATLALGLGLVACRRVREPPATPAPGNASTSSAHPPEFVHPPIPPEPAAARSARPECSSEALGQVAARIRETQKRAVAAVAPRVKDRCAAPPLAELYREVNGELLDRVRICVGQDGPLDAEWNLLESGLASLGVCTDCHRAVANRLADCRRTGDLLERAEVSARDKARVPG
jgi:hypothetical protein